MGEERENSPPGSSASGMPDRVVATVFGGPVSARCAVPDVGALPITEEVPGRYERIREYARGGMGRIFITRDRQLGRDIALKELLPPGALDAPTRAPMASPGDTGTRRARFFQEACITGQLEHPSIVPVYELGRRADGTLYYTMKLVRGRTLERAIAEAGSLRKRLELLGHFLGLCQALAYAHSRGVVHRDIKPSNVMIGEFGETVVLDWGIAKAAGSPDGHAPAPDADGEDDALAADFAERLTQTGEYLGTPHYMAPEQARGQANQVSEATDVYALGVVLYELLTGTRCFGGDTAKEVLGKVASGEKPPIKSVEPNAPAELVAICGRAMQHRPEDRYPSARELAEDIQRFQTGALVEAYEYRPMDRLRRFVWRYRAILATAAVALVVLIVMGVIAVTNILEEQARTEYTLYVSSIGLAKASTDNRRLEDAHRALDEAPAQYRHVEWGLLERLSHPELMTLSGHHGDVMYAEFSPDGTTIATCGRPDGHILLWDAHTGQLEKTIVAAEDDEIHRLDWGPDSRLLVTATSGEEIVIWDAATGARVQEYSGYTPVFSPDGTMMAAATHYGERITLFSVQMGKAVRLFKGPQTYQTRIAFSHDGQRLASTVSHGALYVWDIQGEPLWHFEKGIHKPKATWVLFSPDDRTLLTTGADGFAKLWDAETGEELRTFEGHAGIVQCARFTADGTRVLTAGMDRTVRVWDVATGEQLAVLDGFPQPVNFISLSPDGSCFITNTADSAAGVRPVESLRERYTLAYHGTQINCAAFSPDGKILATGGGRYGGILDNRIALWDTATCQLVRVIEADSKIVPSICFLPDGNRVAVASDNDTALVYALETGALERAFAGHTKNVNVVAVSADGRRLATGGADHTAILWDTATGERLALLEGHTHEVRAAAFNPAGDVLATGARDETVRLWDVPGGQAIHVLPADEELCTLAFSPDGRWLASGGDGSTIKLWDVATGRLDHTFEGHSAMVHAIAFTSDGRRLASGSKDNSVRIWDMKTGRQLLLLDRHKERVRALAFSPDDRFLATGSEDTTVVLWPIADWAAEE